MDKPRLSGLFKIHGLDILEEIKRIHFFCYHISLLGRKLRAVLPVNLVAVVLLGVMGRRDIDAYNRTVIANRKRQLRGGAQFVIQFDLDAVCCKDAGRLPGKFWREMAGIIRNCNAALHGFRAILPNQVRKALGRCADRETVHAVQARAEHAAQARGAERQGRKKAILNLLFIAANCFQLCALLRSQRVRRQPAFVFGHKIHITITS